MEKTMREITFNDVLIKPKYSEIESRKEVDISSDFGPFKLRLPIFSANMKSLTSSKMAIEMYNNGGLGILHRFCSIEESVKNFKEVYDGFCQRPYCCGVSIGIQEDDKERFDSLYESGARLFCIDVANGYSKKMREQIQWIKSKVDSVYIIAGNIATSEAARDLMEWGADCLKIGIGSGKSCMTRRNVGVGVPQLYAIQLVAEEIENASPKPKIISDGGIQYSGDVSKCLRYVDGCMLGSYLSGTSETPGSVFKDENDKYYKVYQGSASGENKVSNGKTSDYVEGIALKVPFRGHVKHILKDLHQCLQSAFSYTNSRTLEEFHRNCEFIEISSGGKEESKI